MTERLIDANRLKRSFEANTPIAFQDCVPGIHAVIDLEPTVDAIPVEWILNNERMPKEGKGHDAIMAMIADWRREHEID